MLTKPALEAFLQSIADLPDVSRILIVGGSCLLVHGLKSAVDDIDLSVPETTPYSLISALTEKHANVSMKHGAFGIDVRADGSLTGGFRVVKGSDCPLVRSGTSAPGVLGLGALFVVKTLAGREKDARDLSIIAGQIAPEAVSKDFAGMLRLNGPEFAENADIVLSEMAAQYRIPVQPSWIAGMNLGLRRGREMAESFGCVFKEAGISR